MTYKRHRQQWTEDEIKRLRELWAITEPEELIADLGRSWNALRNKAYAEGFARSTPRSRFQKPAHEPIPKDVLLLARQVARLKKRLADKEGEHDILRRKLKEALELVAFDPPPFVYKVPTEPKRHQKPEEAFLLVCDAHYAQIVRAIRTGGLSSYNVDIFFERLKNLLEAVVEITDIQRKSVVVDRLWVLLLGDLVEGEDTFLTQPHDIEFHMMRQIIELGDQLPLRLLAPLASHFKQVEIRGVPGNHGKSKTSPSNWDVDAMYHMYLRLAHIPNINMRFEHEKMWMHFKIGNWPHNYFITHGHQMKAWQGHYPWYALERAFARYVGMLNVPINYLFVAHHHQALYLPSLWGATIANGSMVGGSHYSHDRLAKVGAPIQMLVFMNRDHITRIDPIFLAEPPQLDYDEDGILVPALEDEWRLWKTDGRATLDFPIHIG